MSDRETCRALMSFDTIQDPNLTVTIPCDLAPHGDGTHQVVGAVDGAVFVLQWRETETPADLSRREALALIGVAPS
jgi:hypothetical protein